MACLHRRVGHPCHRRIDNTGQKSCNETEWLLITTPSKSYFHVILFLLPWQSHPILVMQKCLWDWAGSPWGSGWGVGPKAERSLAQTQRSVPPAIPNRGRLTVILLIYIFIVGEVNWLLRWKCRSRVSTLSHWFVHHPRPGDHHNIWHKANSNIFIIKLLTVAFPFNSLNINMIMKTLGVKSIFKFYIHCYNLLESAVNVRCPVSR